MARVLVIDDSRTVAKAIVSALRLDGHETETLDQFGLLPDVLSRFAPDAIVLDLVMPGFSGVQFARFIRRYAEDPPPIILHSDSERAKLRAAAREIEPFEVIPKSTDLRELCSAVRRALAEARRSIPTERRRLFTPID